MMMKNKYLLLIALFISSLSFFGAFSQQTFAAGATSNQSVAADLSSLSSDSKRCKSADISKDNCGIIALIVLITNFLSGLVGVVIVMVMIIGGIQYSMAGGDPGKVAAARKRIFDGVVALILFIFSFAILQWLIPGGLF